jgi:chaperonin cofactor prefoldin
VCFLCAGKSGARVQVSETEEELARLQGQVTTVQEKMRELKGRLSLKFGSNINLEEED